MGYHTRGSSSQVEGEAFEEKCMVKSVMTVWATAAVVLEVDGVFILGGKTPRYSRPRFGTTGEIDNNERSVNAGKRTIFDVLQRFLVFVTSAWNYLS
jgi:hypothetical protein